MMRVVVGIAVLAIWLGSVAGCQSPGPGDTDRASGGRDEVMPLMAEPEQRDPAGRLGRFQRAAPGRGHGRRQTESGAAVSYHPVRLGPEEAESLGIVTAKAAYRSVRSLHSAMGKVMAPPSRMAKVSYAFPARIAAVEVNIGDWVEKGQPVLTLESEEVGRAKSDYYKATADLELARQNYQREQRLFDRGVGARKNTLATEAEFKVAQANLEAAEKKLHVLGFSEDEVQSIAATHQIRAEITVFAPITGRVVEHNAILGSMIDQTTDLMTIMDPTVMWVNAEIFERDIAKIRVGQEVRVSVPAYPGEVFRGKTSYIGEMMNPETRTISVRTEVPNRDFKLKQGMFADVDIILNGAHSVLTVPADAVIEDNTQDIVFVGSAGHFAPRVVTVSGRQNGYCAIAGGLQAGEEVVVKNAYTLKSKLYDELLRDAGVH